MFVGRQGLYVCKRFGCVRCCRDKLMVNIEKMKKKIGDVREEDVIVLNGGEMEEVIRREERLCVPSYYF